MASDDRPPAFWQTLPGILTGISALLTAVTGLIAVLYQGGLLGQNDKPPPKQPLSATQAIIGSWEGEASDSDGQRFHISLIVREGCALGRNCGEIAVSHLPCEGRITLVGIVGESVEFSVGDFSESSSPDCSPGAGEIFRLRSDGLLDYETTYDPRATALLERRGD